MRLGNLIRETPSRMVRKISSKEPKEYISKHKVELQQLSDQLIPVDDNLWQVGQYEEFLEKRASSLAEKANALLGDLKNG